MKCTIIAIAVSVATLLAAPVFAGNEEIAAKLAEASSPANVKAVALQQKKAYCDQNAKNKALQASEKESYIFACMNNNEALLQFALINRKIASPNDDIAAIGLNNAPQPEGN